MHHFIYKIIHKYQKLSHKLHLHILNNLKLYQGSSKVNLSHKK